MRRSTGFLVVASVLITGVIYSTQSFASVLGFSAAVDNEAQGRGGPIGDVRVFDNEAECKAWSAGMTDVMKTIPQLQTDLPNWSFKCFDAETPTSAMQAVALRVVRGYWIEERVSDLMVIDVEYFETIDECRHNERLNSGGYFYAYMSTRLGTDLRSFYRRSGFEFVHGFSSCFGLESN